MKIALTTVLAGLGLLAGTSLNAQVTNVLTITGTVLGQNTIDSNGNADKPLKMKFSTKDILNQLQQDVGIDPAGAKLVVDDSGKVLVLQKNGTLVDVSTILSVSGDDAVFTSKGTQGQTAYSETDYGTGTIKYNNSADINVSMTGATTSTIKDSAPDKNGNVKETQSHSIKNAVGAGTFSGTSAVMTGSASGKGTGFFK